MYSCVRFISQPAFYRVAPCQARSNSCSLSGLRPAAGSLPALVARSQSSTSSIVDVLHHTFFVVRGKYFAAGSDPAGPVGKTVRGVVRTRDQTWTDVQHPVRQHLLDDPLALCLEPSISLLRNLLDRRVWELPHRRLFVGPRLKSVG